MSVTIVDVGCAAQGDVESMGRLKARFGPAAAFYGFDPLLPAHEVCRVSGPGYRAELAAKAAWAYDGELVLSRGRGADATALRHDERWDEGTRVIVPCFDFAEWLDRLEPNGGDVVVKMDAEGAEFVLLPLMLERDLDLKVTLLLIDWHDAFLPDGGARRARIEPRLRCEVEPWQ